MSGTKVLVHDAVKLFLDGLAVGLRDRRLRIFFGHIFVDRCPWGLTGVC